MLRAILITLAMLAGGPTLAIEVGQLDTFEENDTGDWKTGKTGTSEDPNTISIEADCGDDGDGDDCLRVITTTGSSSPGSRLAMINTTSWSGDWVSAGIGGIALRAENISETNTTLELRVMLVGAGGRCVSRDSLVVPRFSGYIDGLIRISPGDCIADSSSSPSVLENALRDVTRVWVAHNPEGFQNPNPARAKARFDDIMAMDDSIFTTGFELP